MTDQNPFSSTAEESVPASGNGERYLQCPKCSARFSDPRGLGTHLSRVHGVKGKSKSATAYRESNAKKANPVGRPKGNGKKNTVSHHAKPHAAVTPQVDLALLGYAMAKLEDHAHQIARENDLEEKAFTRLVAGHLANLTQR